MKIREIGNFTYLFTHGTLGLTHTENDATRFPLVVTIFPRNKHIPSVSDRSLNLDHAKIYPLANITRTKRSSTITMFYDH